MTHVVIEDRSLLAAEIVQDPHPYFHELRAKDPVHWSEIHRGWLLTRHDDVGAAFRDLRLSSSRVSSLPANTIGSRPSATLPSVPSPAATGVT